MTQIQSSYGFGFGALAEQKVVTFTGGAGAGAVGTVNVFTVTGAVMLRLVCICTESLVDGVGTSTISIGITGNVQLILVDLLATSIDAGETWAVDDEYETVALSIIAPSQELILANSQDIIATITVQPVTDGTLIFTAFWTPLTPGASVVAA
jgi:hypothetical protein